MKPVDIKRLQRRSRRLIVRGIAQGTYLVASRSTPQAQYIVTVEYDPEGIIRARCTCLWAQHGGTACSHVLATLSHMAAGKHRALSFWLSEDEARKQRHRTLRLAGAHEEGDVFITSRPAPNDPPREERPLMPQTAA